MYDLDVCEDDVSITKWHILQLYNLDIYRAHLPNIIYHHNNMIDRSLIFPILTWDLAKTSLSIIKPASYAVFNCSST